MKCTLSDLKSKEVIETNSGTMLGRIDDIEINMENSSVEAMIVYGRPRLFGLLGRDDDIIIKYRDIDLIGKDTVLVSRSEMSQTTHEKQSVFTSADEGGKGRYKT